MIDCRTETHTHPSPFPVADYRRLMVLAPHPDDEIYGCGGLILLARAAGAEVTALVLTDGGAASAGADLATRRREESGKAAELLGHDVAFLDFPDRALRLDAALIAALETWAERLAPDLVLAPSLTDPHPDHQAVALAAIRLLGRFPHRADLAFYETNGGLTHVTHLLDITPVSARKDAAMAAFATQEAEQPYRSRIGARDHYRAFSLGPQAQAAEAYCLAPLRAQGFAALLPGLDPLYRHHRLDAAASPEDAPTVSVIVRTIGDARLEDAVASALAQTYRPIEIVVVAALGQDPFAAVPSLAAHPLVRCVRPSAPLDRPAAANAGLDAAQGRYCLFLDDDDLLLPDHLEKLVAALRAQPEALAAHADVRVLDGGGQALRDYAYDVTPARLLGANLTPIHAVLFDRRLATERGCRFDETLPRREDWDFWLQVAQHTTFVRAPGVSALYRYRDRASLGEDDAREQLDLLRRRVLAKWRARIAPEAFDAALGWHARALDEAESRLAVERERASALEAEGTALQRRFDETLAQVQSSTSWRLTAPLRWLAAKVRAR